MGFFNFASKIGKKLFGDDDDAGEAIEKHINEDNPGVEGMKIEVVDGVAKIKGKAKDKSAYEKAILMAGNVLGISSVEAAELELESGEVIEEAAQPTFYTIEKGDTLWGIASSQLGKGSRYPEIFEANREVIKDPDKIYPGQQIRIPEK
ncbi:MAG: peptidoglycan-binding protein LysM [Arenicellales bacterium]